MRSRRQKGKTNTKGGDHWLLIPACVHRLPRCGGACSTLRQPEDKRSCTPSLRLIRQPAIRVEYPSFTTCGRGFCHGIVSLFVSAGAGCPGVAVYHAPWGVAKRLRCRMLDDTGAPTPTAHAPPRAETLCGPHHQAALRCMCPCERPLPTRPCSSTPAPHHDA